METPIGDDDDSHLGDFLEDTQYGGSGRGCAECLVVGHVVKQVLDSL